MGLAPLPPSFAGPACMEARPSLVWQSDRGLEVAVVVKTNGIPFWGFRCTAHFRILEPILVGIEMFTGGTGF